MRNKKGVSGVIATVLLILLTITAITILTAVLVPFTKDNLKEGSRCTTVLPEVSLVFEKTCYYADSSIPSNDHTNITVRLGNVDLDGIYVVVESDTNSNSCDVLEEDSCVGVNDDEILEIPSKGGGQKTYTYNEKYTHVSIGGISQGKKCPISEELDLKKCVR